MAKSYYLTPSVYQVPRRGLEPPIPCGSYHLKVVRLPISPPGHSKHYNKNTLGCYLYALRSLNGRGIFLFFLSFRFCRRSFGSRFYRKFWGGDRFIALEIHLAGVPQLALHLLSGLLANEIKLCATHLRTPHDLDRVNSGRIEGEGLFYPYPRERRTYRKHSARFGAVFHREDEPLKGLETRVFSNLLFFVGTLTAL